MGIADSVALPFRCRTRTARRNDGARASAARAESGVEGRERQQDGGSYRAGSRRRRSARGGGGGTVKLRPAFLPVHRWFGLTIGLVVMVSAFTGAGMAF